MTDELEIIDRLKLVRRILRNNIDTADHMILAIIENAEQKVAQFEEQFELEMDDGA